MPALPGPHLRKRAAQHHRYPSLLRGVTATAPNAIWGSDITYIRLRSGWLYLVVVLDWYAGYVMSWALSETLELPVVRAAVDEALTVATPTIWNSDQGSHATSPQLTSKLEAAGAKISMDGRGRAHDTIFTERRWRSSTYEEVYLHDYGSPREARDRTTRYLHFYNHERPHQALDYRRPAEVDTTT